MQATLRFQQFKHRMSVPWGGGGPLGWDHLEAQPRARGAAARYEEDDWQKHPGVLWQVTARSLVLWHVQGWRQ